MHNFIVTLKNDAHWQKILVSIILPFDNIAATMAEVYVNDPHTLEQEARYAADIGQCAPGCYKVASVEETEDTPIVGNFETLDSGPNG